MQRAPVTLFYLFSTSLLFLRVHVALKLRLLLPFVSPRGILSTNQRLSPKIYVCLTMFESEVYCRRRSGNFWRMRASLGLACARAATLGTQVVGRPRSRPRAAAHPRTWARLLVPGL